MSEPAAPYVTKSDFAYTRVRELILSGEFEPGAVLNQATLAQTNRDQHHSPARGAAPPQAARAWSSSTRTATRGSPPSTPRRRATCSRSAGPRPPGRRPGRRAAHQGRHRRDAGEPRRPAAAAQQPDVRAAGRPPPLPHRDLPRLAQRLLIETLDGLWDKADRYRRHGLQVERSDEERDAEGPEHRLLFEAIVEGDGATAAEVMRRTSRPAWARSRPDRLVRHRHRPPAVDRPPRPDRLPGRRLLVLLLLHSMLAQVITFVLRPTAAYRALELDVPTAWLGALGASFAVVPLVLAVPSGQATDRFGERRVMLVGSVLMALSGGIFRRPAAAAWGWSSAASCSAPGTCCRSSDSRPRSPTARPGPVRHRVRLLHVRRVAGQAAGPALITLSVGRRIPDTQTIFPRATELGVLLVCTRAADAGPRAGAAATPRRGGMGTCSACPGSGPRARDQLRRAVRRRHHPRLPPALGADRGLAAGVIGLLLTLRAVASMTSRFFLGRLVGWSGGAG